MLDKFSGYKTYVILAVWALWTLAVQQAWVVPSADMVNLMETLFPVGAIAALRAGVTKSGPVAGGGA